MADVSQYSFTMKELTTALIKEQKLHEGRWMSGFEFNLAAGNIGSGPSDVRPSAIVGIANILLLRVKDGDPGTHFTLDAAEVNPPKAK